MNEAEGAFERVQAFAGIWGLIFFLVLFLAVLAYVFWPGNKRKFDKAARRPLEDDDGPQR
jgi:cytochrome c oxidase cbb3-type subunit 4